MKKVLHDRGLSTAVGDEGGFAPTLNGTEDALESIMIANEKAGYKPGVDVMIGLDCASSEFYSDGIYDYSKFEGETDKKRISDEQVDYIEEPITKHPIDSIEMGCANSILIKINQIGSLSEILDAIERLTVQVTLLLHHTVLARLRMLQSQTLRWLQTLVRSRLVHSAVRIVWLSTTSCSVSRRS